MNSLAAVEQHIQYLPREWVEMVLEIRNIVADVCPQAVERLDRRGIVYFDAKRGGSVKGGICMLFFGEKSLHLDFPHGAFLPDPTHLLSGNNLAKWGTHLTKYDDTPWEEIAALITASANFDPTALPQNKKI